MCSAELSTKSDEMRKPKRVAILMNLSRVYDRGVIRGKMIAQWAADHLVDRGLEHFAYCGISRGGLDQWNEVRCDSFRRRIVKQGRQCSVFTGRRHLLKDWDRMLQELTEWLAGLPKPVGLMA